MAGSFPTVAGGVLKGVAIVVAAASLAPAPAWGRAGALDRSFGQRGIVRTSFGPASSATAQAVALTRGGRVVVAGQAQTGQGSTVMAVARYKPSGALDRSFGSGGLVQTAFAQGGGPALAVAVDGRGRTIVAGSSGNDFAVARYTPRGRLDRSFGSGGEVVTSFPGLEVNAQAIALLPNGSTVVGGGGSRSDGTGGGFALVRYRSGGALDRSFGTQGRVFTPFGAGADVSGVHALALWRGRVIAAGLLDDPFGGGGAFALARYTGSGQLDSSFSGDGRVTTVLGQEAGAQGVLVVPGGRIVAAGAAQPMPGQGDRFALTRYLSNGTLDSSFGQAGIVSTNLPGGDALGNAIAGQRDGRLVVAGQANQPDGTTSIFGMARYLSGGALDTSFGSGGIVTTSFGKGLMAAANGVAIQHNGRIVVVGSNGSIFIVARYLAS
ncbi:MAG: hypothetical protein ACJ76X_11735 [Solirubrobacteraceae bacterium]